MGSGSWVSAIMEPKNSSEKKTIPVNVLYSMDLSLAVGEAVKFLSWTCLWMP
jgi:hypothetical protein